MELALIIVAIACVSILISYVSIKSERKKQKHVEEVQKKLAKGRVLFYSSSTRSSSS